MPFLTLLAAAGAAMTWAAASLLAHRPARRLGAFAFTRIQLTAASVVLAGIVTLSGEWATIDWRFAPHLVVSSLVGVVLTNLAMSECLRRGGPRRTQLLLSLNAPLAGIVAFVALGETMAPAAILGTGLMLAGIATAILTGRRRVAEHPLEAVEGSLATVVVLGVAAAAFQAVGLVAAKPVMLAGASPLAVSGLRIMGGAWALSVLALVATGPAGAPLPTRAQVLEAVVPGLLGYVVASSLLLLAIRSGPTGLAAAIGSAVPVFVLPILWAVTRDPPSWGAWLGAALVLAGALTGLAAP